MAKVLQHRRGTTAEHSNFTGAAGEITYDTTDKRLVVHDGATKGGIPVAKKSEVDAIDVGVISFNGSKGAVTYSAPVSSVNGQTGAVSIDVGVTSFNGSKGAVTYSAPVSSVNGKTGAVTGLVTSVNGSTADASGNVTLSVNDGTVTQKYYNAKLTAYASGNTVTVSNLTPNKPVYILVKALSSSGGTCYPPVVTSGAVLNAEDKSYTLSKGAMDYCCTIASATSLSMQFKSNSTSSEKNADYTIYVYQ